MTTVRHLWSLMRGPKSRFAPGGRASCEQPARPRPCALPEAAEPAATLDLEPAAVPEPDLPLLLASGETMLHEARALGRTPALAIMQIDDLPETELVFGRAGVDKVMAAVITGLGRASGGRGLVVRTAADTFALLVPGGGAGAAIAALQARFGKPCTIEVGFGRDEILVVPDVMVHPVGPQDSIAQVYADLRRYIAKARKHRQTIQDCLPQRPACGSVPVSSPVDFALPAPQQQYYPPQPATIPVPLAIH